MVKKEAKTYASIELPFVAAAVDGLLRLESETQAAAFLDNLAQHHIIAREQLPAKGKSLTLWIRGYDVTQAEAEKGAIGNVVVLALKKIAGRWSIYPTKIALDPAKHPQRAYVARGTHPNWAHPLLKAMKGGKHYPTLEALQADLAAIHAQYPTTTIPTKAKLYVMIFSRKVGDAAKAPVEKWVLEPRITPEGSYYAEIYPNTGKSKRSATTTTTRDTSGRKKTTEGEPAGFFTARETLKRRKKAKR